MHGRLKIKTTAEQQEAKRIEREKKLKIYKAGTQLLFSKREKQELDDEALSLSKEFLVQNPDFYTLWNFRKEILIFLKAQKTEDEFQNLIVQELELTQSCLRVNPKSYGAWHHRRWTMNNIPKKDWNHELKLCNMFLALDDRNFHGWDYRRLVCKAISIQPEAELEYTSNLIKENFSNYSAWHYRSKLLPLAHPDNNNSVNEEKKLEEFMLVQNAAFTDPDDQSVWFYHRWLLGRGSSPLEVISVGIYKDIQIFTVLLSSPVKLNQTCRLDFFSNNILTNVTWKNTATDINYASSVWYCHLSEEVLCSIDETKFSVTLVNGNEISTLNCSFEQPRVWKYEDFSNFFCSEINAATKDVLLRELDSCKQLYEMEPENKWTLFTTVLLMKAIDSKHYNQLILVALEKLMKVDAMKANYYRDLRSKFVIENFIEPMDTACSEVKLMDNKLFSLHHCEFFIHVKKIDLSANNLTSFHLLHYCASAKEIILDDNKISTCQGFKYHPSLKKLSLKNNHIEHCEDLLPLKTCQMLKELFLEGNPVIRYEDRKLVIEKEFENILSISGHL